MSAGAKTASQRLYYILNTRLEEACGRARVWGETPEDAGRIAGLREAMALLEEIDPDDDADAAYVVGRVY